MTFLFDITHPAHVHFFRVAIGELERAGHRVIVTSRDKDITHRLLDAYGIEYTCISREANSTAGLAAELITRNLALIGIVLRERPDAMAAIGGISTSQVGFLMGIRNYIFFDTEHAKLQILLSYPFATEVVTPTCYSRPVWGRHVTYPGFHELAYVHPDRFEPDPQILIDHGIEPGEPYSVVRFVSWKALHDVGARGIGIDDKRRLVKTLSTYGKVFITSETPLPGDFEQYQLPMAPQHVHHLLAFARLFIGESATMASESVILGTPAVFVDHTGRGYTDEQEHSYHLCANFKPDQVEEAIARAESILRDGLKEDVSFRANVSRMLADKVDTTSLIMQKMLSRH